MALLRAELYHTLDDLEELSAHVPDAGADGAWKYLPSLAAITPDAVSSGANVVSTAVGPQRRDGKAGTNGDVRAVFRQPAALHR